MTCLFKKMQDFMKNCKLSEKKKNKKKKQQKKTSITTIK